MPETPIVETPINQPEDVKTETKAENVTKQKSPAQDLREIQQLLVMGIFPGQMSPAVVKGFQLLEAMAKGVEAQSAGSNSGPAGV
jgi:hypothetical protein